MKTILHTLFVLFCFLQLSANEHAVAYAQLEEMYSSGCGISYRGGEKRLNKEIAKNLTYPPQAVKDSISGTVYLSFIIDTKGHSTEIRVIKGIREDLDKEAVRCVDLLDDWIVGRNNGKKVKMSHTIPITFSLSAVAEKRNSRD